MTVLYLVRHGQTDVNLMNQVQGQLDSHGLNTEGQRQVAALADYLQRRKLPGDVIVSSPLRRARETAAALAGALGLGIGYDDRLREIDCGDCEGVEIGQVRAAVYDPPMTFRDALDGSAIVAGTGAVLRDYYASADPRYDFVHHPGGETKRAAADRAFAALREMIGRQAGAGHIWVVSHSTLIRLVLSRIAPEEAVKKLDCAEVVQLRHDPLALGGFEYLGRMQG